eukprot:scaffold34646_cov173-Amphora_coffeaeformis.AAC.22
MDRQTGRSTTRQAKPSLSSNHKQRRSEEESVGAAILHQRKRKLQHKIPSVDLIRLLHCEP